METDRQREHRETQLRRARWNNAAIDRMVRDNYIASHMSDSKWVRLFDAAWECPQPVSGCMWRFVDEDRTWQTSLPDGDDVSDGYYECMYGIFVMKHVESVVLLTPDSALLCETLMRHGEFCTICVESGVQVVGYEAR